MNVLVLAPHPDDEAIGCGGSLCLHSAAGDRVVVAFLTSGERGLPHLPVAEARAIREREAVQSCEVIGVGDLHFLRMADWQLWGHLEALGAACATLLESERPDFVYFPHTDEWHPDHQACTFAVTRAVADLGLKACAGRAYEVWTPLQAYRHVEDISSTVRRKMRAIRCHASQVSQFRYDLAIRGLNCYRGVTTQRGRYCEVFADAGWGATPDGPSTNQPSPADDPAVTGQS